VMAAMAPYYALRLVAGGLFLGGAALMAVNLWRTMRGLETVPAAPPVRTLAAEVGT